ncbi:ATP-binding protein [Pseudomonas aeruginosa]|nr:sensor histidine kinase [Pseudomonas aeruginosa]
MPRSLLGRMLLLTLLAVLVAQGLSSLFWLSHLRSSQREGLLTSSRSLAYSMAASVSYFRSLPLGYRPLVLDQLRSMGGTRFFVSLNDRPLEMRALPDTPNKQAVLEIVQDVLHQRLGKEVELQVEFVSPDELRLFNGALKLDELPRSWAHYALTLEPVNPPVLVTQIRIGDSEWLYIASLMPAPYVSLEPEGLQPQQVLSIVFTSLLLLLFTGLLMHWQSRPLKRLARAARDLALGSPSAALEERGASELVEVVGRAAEPYPGKPLALKRCIGNLLDNALKYGERARLSLEDGPEAVVLHVDDDGPGVPEQRLEQIFEPRFRLSPRGQGYGLGLGIARNIAHTHGGEVSLQNRREGGLRVSLRLPRLGLE